MIVWILMKLFIYRYCVNDMMERMDRIALKLRKEMKNALQISC